MKMLRLLLAAALILAPFEQALAGAGTITTKDAAGVTRTFVVVTDGTGNFVAPTVICDATAAATCAAVGAAGLKVDGSGATQPVSGTVTANIGTVGTLATAANQSTGNTSLSSIDTKTPALGQALAAASVPVILPAATITTLTPPTTVTANIGTAGTLALAANQTNGTSQTKVTDGSNIAAVKAASTAPVAADPAMVVAMSPNVSYTFYTNSATGTTAATTATLAGAASVTTYICGFSIRANATAAATGNATVTGTISGTLNFTQWTAPLASGVGVTEMIFSPCIPASAANTSIAVVSAAPGSGGVVSSTAWGYKL